MKITFCLKNGDSITMQCAEFEVNTRTTTGELVGFSAKSITENKILYIDTRDISCIYRHLNDELEGGE